MNPPPSHSTCSAQRPGRLLLRVSVVLSLAWLVACSEGPAQPAAVAPASAGQRFAAVADVLPMPAQPAFETHELSWRDEARSRDVAARLYLPAAAVGAVDPAGDGARPAADPVPLVVFSHGIGGSRAGYTYLGQYWAAHGYAVLHVQHAGSDRELWFGNPLTLVSRLQTAAREEEAVHRVRDLSFALDHLLAGPFAARLDPSRIAAAGHSYGANTVMLAAGAQVQRGTQVLALRDARIRAAVILSAPPFYGEPDLAAILRPVSVPTLHITATADDIRIPGYYSGYADREAVYEAMSASERALVVFRDGSHSVFTDRLGTGGAALNPRIKAATRELALAFLDARLRGVAGSVGAAAERHVDLLARLDERHAACDAACPVTHLPVADRTAARP